MRKEWLRLENIKVDHVPYGALHGIYLSLYEGEIMGMVFSNLREKATFVQLLRAEVSPGYGKMYLGEEILKRQEELRGAVYVINRASDLMPRLSIWENIFFDDLPAALLHKSAYLQRLRRVMRRFGIHVDLDQGVAQLSHAQTIQMELLKAYILGRKVIIFADVSYYLTTAEMEETLALAKKMTVYGYSFLLIDNPLGMMMKNADRITIIKYGRTKAFFPRDELRPEIISRILWEDTVPEGTPAAEKRFFPPTDKDPVALSFQGVSWGVLRDLSFALERGKCLGVNYQDERHGDDFATLLRGDNAPLRGEISILGRRLRARGAWMAQRQGLCFTEENPREKLLIEGMSVLDNLGFVLKQKTPLLWLRRDYQTSLRRTLEQLCGEDFWQTPIADLTPMQAQKLVYSRWIMYHPAVVVCLNPFTGMDYQVDRVTEMMLSKMLERGISVLLVDSHLPAQALEDETLYLEGGTLSKKHPYI